MQEFPVDKDNKIDLTLQTQSFCDAMTSQFTKILKCDQGNNLVNMHKMRSDLHSNSSANTFLQDLKASFL